MRISDWSSDVCSSDLNVSCCGGVCDGDGGVGSVGRVCLGQPASASMATKRNIVRIVVALQSITLLRLSANERVSTQASASEIGERRVGKGCVSKCRSRWCLYHETKKNQTKPAHTQN